MKILSALGKVLNAHFYQPLVAATASCVMAPFYLEAVSVRLQLAIFLNFPSLLFILLTVGFAFSKECYGRIKQRSLYINEWFRSRKAYSLLRTLGVRMVHFT